MERVSLSNNIHKLTKKQTDSLKKPGRYNDGGGLYLHVRKSGTKSWIYRYRSNGRLRELGLGRYGDANGLIQARKSASSYREGLSEGKDPILEKTITEKLVEKELGKALRFREILDEFFASKERVGFFTSERTQKRWHFCLHNHAKALHNKPISEITTVDVFKVLEPIWLSKTETASRTRLYLEAVLSWAKTMGYRSGENPAVWRGNLDQLITSKERVRPVRHHPGMDWQDLPSFFTLLTKLEMPAARLLEFIILTASRSGEARGAVWSEIDFDKRVWEIPVERMKMKRPHLVPLEGRVLEILETEKANRESEFVFLNRRSRKEFSYNAPMVVLKKLGTKGLTVHGFRSSFKTWALENTSFPTQAIEFALAHETKNAVERAYIRGNKMLDRRREVMIAWDQFCSG